MKDSIRRKLDKLDERFEEIGRLLSDAGVIARQNQFRELSMEYSKLQPLIERFRRFVTLEGDLATARELASDKPMRPPRRMGEEEIADPAPRIAAEEQRAASDVWPGAEGSARRQQYLLLEVRAGTGGGTRRPCLRATSFACTRVMPNPRAGRASKP